MILFFLIIHEVDVQAVQGYKSLYYISFEMLDQKAFEDFNDKYP